MTENNRPQGQQIGSTESCRDTFTKAAWIIPSLTETECHFIRRLADYFKEYGEDEVKHCFKVGEYNHTDAIKRHFDNVAAILRHEFPFK